LTTIRPAIEIRRSPSDAGRRDHQQAPGNTLVWFFALVVGVIAVAHILWLVHFRTGLPLDIDEAGYLNFAFADRHGFATHGLLGFFDAVVRQRQYAPLVPMVAAPVLAVFGNSPVVGFSTQLVFLGALAAGGFGLGDALGGRRAGFLAGVIVVLSAGGFDFGRTFLFVLASTAFFTISVWALIKTERFARWTWSVAWGAATGLMLLSRTFTLAFLPALGLAATLLVLRGPRPLRIPLRNLALGGLIACGTAGWWYVPNISPLVRYLINNGYQTESQYYDTSGSPAGIHFWTARLLQLLNQGLYLGPALILLVAVVIAVSRWLRHQRGRRWRAADVLEWSATPFGTVVVVAAASYVSLTSSRTGGPGYAVPLIPLVAALGGAALLLLPGAMRICLVVPLLAALLGSAITKTMVTGPLASPRCLTVPGIGCVTLTDGRGIAQQQLALLGMDATNPVQARRGAPGAWARLPATVVGWIHDDAARAHVTPVVFFASRDRLLNTNTVGLAWWMRYGGPLLVGQLRPDDGGDTVANYYQWMDDPRRGQPTFLLATDRSTFEYRPRVSQPRAEQAARLQGFVVVRAFRLPDGRTARLYERESPPPVFHAKYHPNVTDAISKADH
jgi:hypothetical protein